MKIEKIPQNTADKKKILIVDDEQDILDTFIDMFKLKGYKCDGARNGSQALNLTRKNQYSIIISDINMPIMNGAAFFKKFKEKDSTTPFVFITGYQVSNELRDIVSKANAIVNKPITFQEFYTLVENQINTN